jgi:hypothetical protein
MLVAFWFRARWEQLRLAAVRTAGASEAPLAPVAGALPAHAARVVTVVLTEGDGPVFALNARHWRRYSIAQSLSVSIANNRIFAKGHDDDDDNDLDLDLNIPPGGLALDKLQETKTTILRLFSVYLIFLFPRGLLLFL